MLTGEEIEGWMDIPTFKVSKIDAQIAQYYMRQAFEEGYRAASTKEVTKADWLPDWLKSQTRAVLVANGVITGKDGYK